VEKEQHEKASGNTRKHTCELPQRRCKRQRKKWKICHFLALAYTFAFVFHTCEPGEHKCKRKRNMKNTRSMPPRLSSNQDGVLHSDKTSTSSAIFNLVPRALVPDCWPRVTRTLEPSRHTEMRVRISFCLRLRSNCLRLLLRLRHMCEEAFRAVISHH